MIEAVDVTKRFGEKIALDHVQMLIGDGEIYGLIGSNGSGKSTLMRLFSGIYAPEDGTVRMDGVPVFDRAWLKEKIAYVGDTPFFFPYATVKEMARFYRKMFPRFDNRLYQSLLEVFPLDYKARISAMSKGKQRQAALITAIAASPKYLLLDEAFDGLDPVARKTLKNILIDRAETCAMTTVIASHNLSELEFLCDHAGLLHEGKLIFSDSVEHLKGQLHKVQAVFRQVPEKTAFADLKLLKIERSGSLLQMIVRGDEADIMRKIEQLSPIFSECVEPSLEEILMYELEGSGYDAGTLSY